MAAQTEEKVEIISKSEMALRIYLPVLLSFGGPLNLVALTQLIRKYRNSMIGQVRARQSHRIFALFLLKLNVSITNLMIMFFYVPGQIGWLYTVQWCGGDVFCKIYKFLSLLAFQSSSFAVVCVAAIRVQVVRKGVGASWGQSSVTSLLSFTWVLAVLLSSPQLYIWEAARPFASFNRTIAADFDFDFVQCTTYFRIQEFQTGAHSQLETVYHILTLCSTFWLPAVFISIAYAYVFVMLRRYANAPVSEISDNASRLRTNVPSGSTLQVPRWRRRLRSKRRLFSQTGLLVLVYLVCWLPYFASSLFPTELKALNTLLTLNAAINPLVYAF